MTIHLLHTYPHTYLTTHYSTISYSKTELRLIKFNSASLLHIPIEHADYVNKLITGVLVSLAIHGQSQVHL